VFTQVSPVFGSGGFVDLKDTLEFPHGIQLLLVSGDCPEIKAVAMYNLPSNKTKSFKE
jgi:hypothetical protein